VEEQMYVYIKLKHCVSIILGSVELHAELQQVVTTSALSKY